MKQLELPVRGVLRPMHIGPTFTLERYAPAPELEQLIERYWIVAWDRGTEPPYIQQNLPFPCVNLVVDRATSGIFGVVRHRFSKEIAGSDRAFGIKFRAGAFGAFYRKPMHGLTDKVLPVRELFDDARTTTLERALRETTDVDANVAAANEFLLAHEPHVCDDAVLAGRIADAIMDDSSLTRISDVAARFDMSERSLQRLFRQHVGVGPKWLIRRFRLQNAADLLASGGDLHGTTLALSLGFYDQAHFIRDFTELVGVSPSEYARQSRVNGER